MDDNQEIVILYTKYPRPGHSKTRLIPALGSDGAAKLQKNMTAEMVAKLEQLQNGRPVTIAIHFDGGTHEQMEQWLGNSHQFCHQSDGDLGVRMAESISDYLGTFARIILVGSDCPGVNELTLCEALDALKKNDLVIGPTFDGGYYLIGVQGSVKRNQLHTLFQDIKWSTNSVFTDTIKKAGQLRLSCHILPKLHDIDTPDDLRYIGYHSDAQ